MSDMKPILLSIQVDTDDMEYKNGGKTLDDIACERLNAILKAEAARAIHIEKIIGP